VKVGMPPIVLAGAVVSQWISPAGYRNGFLPSDPLPAPDRAGLLIPDRATE
jgi:hypothetical protein